MSAASRRAARPRRQAPDRRRGYPGVFVVLEGLDGAGTTTQAERLSGALRAEGYRTFVTREPSDGPVGTLIRQALTGRLGLPKTAGPLGPQTLALLFAADRTDHLEAQVIPALNRGDVVLCDRYVLSSLAYQGSSLPMEWVEGINGFAARPDLTFFLEIDVDVAAQRRVRRGGDAELYEDELQQRRIAQQYLRAIERRERDERILRVDGARPISEVTDELLRVLRPFLAAAAEQTPRA